MATSDLRALGQPVDINSADVDELRSLRGVGPTIANRIVEGRPYAAVRDLERVKGIGPKTLEANRKRIIVFDSP